MSTMLGYYSRIYEKDLFLIIIVLGKCIAKLENVGSILVGQILISFYC